MISGEIELYVLRLSKWSDKWTDGVISGVFVVVESPQAPEDDSQQR